MTVCGAPYSFFLPFFFCFLSLPNIHPQHPLHHIVEATPTYTPASRFFMCWPCEHFGKRLNKPQPAASSETRLVPRSLARTSWSTLFSARNPVLHSLFLVSMLRVLCLAFSVHVHFFCSYLLLVILPWDLVSVHYCTKSTTKETIKSAFYVPRIQQDSSSAICG